MFLFAVAAYLLWMVLYLFFVGAVVAYFVATLLVYWFACGGAFLVARVRGTAVPVKVAHPSFNRPQFQLSEAAKFRVALWTGLASIGFLIWWVNDSMSTYS